jgi:NAD(P)-dependent dehydrogenase (short-subunit alcohol dehydrogenase family)
VSPRESMRQASREAGRPREQRRALILGAASGIGAAGARRLAADGWRLVLLDRAAEYVGAVAEEIGAHAIGVDAADPDALRSALHEAVAELGGLDAAWSNVGVQIGGDVTELSVEQLDRSYAVNLRSHFVVAQVAAAAIGSDGSILVTASNSGLQTEPQLLAYATTKAATIALMRGMARDLAPRRIRVNALCPGYVDTPFNAPIWSTFGGRDAFLARIADVVPLRRMASPEEVAGLACFLLGEQAAYVTGHALVADGGELVS